MLTDEIFILRGRTHFFMGFLHFCFELVDGAITQAVHCDRSCLCFLW